MGLSRRPPGSTLLTGRGSTRLCWGFIATALPTDTRRIHPGQKRLGNRRRRPILVVASSGEMRPGAAPDRGRTAVMSEELAHRALGSMALR